MSDVISNSTFRTFRFASIATLLTLLTACGGGGGNSDDVLGGSSRESNNPPADPPVTTTPSVQLSLGSGEGVSFQPGELMTGLGSNTLAHGGELEVTVHVVDSSDNALYSDGSVAVYFSSDCSSAGQASECLNRMATGEEIKSIHINVDEEGNFSYELSA